jgi:hypothetical protein
MRDELERRLGELRSEFEAGRRLQADLQLRLSEVNQTLLRIGGAIQVLEELLAGSTDPHVAGNGRAAGVTPASTSSGDVRDSGG